MASPAALARGSRARSAARGGGYRRPRARAGPGLGAPQRGAEFGSGFVAVVGDESEGTGKDRLQFGGGADRDCTQRRRLHGEPLPCRGRRCRSREGKPARDHLEHGQGQRVDIRAGVGGKPLYDLGSQVGDGPQDGTRSFRGERPRDCIGHAEVGHLGDAILVDEDVLGLHVAVDDALFVGVLEGAGDLAAIADSLGLAEAALGFEQLAHGEAVDVFHDQEVVALVLSRIVDSNDVRVLQAGDDAGLPLDTVDKLAGARASHGIAEDLDRDPA